MSAENKALVRRLYEEAVTRQNVDLIDDLCAPEFIDHNPEPGSGGSLKEVKTMFRQLLAAFPDFSLTVQDQIAEGDKVVCRLNARGTHRGTYMGIASTGRSVEIGGIDIIRVVNGKAVERWGYFDDVKLLQQLGVMQGPRST
jgi:steroid delta-isomerase-like uncharacterized protein